MFVHGFKVVNVFMGYNQHVIYVIDNTSYV